MFHRLFGGHKISSVLWPTIEDGPDDLISKIIIEAPLRREDKVVSIINSYKGEVLRTIRIIPAIEARVPVETVRHLAGTKYVKKIWEDTSVYALGDRIDPEKNIFLTGAPEGRGNSIIIALLDTGIHSAATTIQSGLVVGWKDIVQARPLPYDDHGHGTFVSKLITDNRIRVGLDVRLVEIKVLNGKAIGNLTDLLLGLEWCIQNQESLGIQVINLSLGTQAQGSYRQDLLCRATMLAWQSQLTVTAAAGNTTIGKSLINSPGLNPRIITIGELKQQQEVFGGSTRFTLGKSGLVRPDLLVDGNKHVDVAGVAGPISTASAATAIVTCGAAYILHMHPTFQPWQIKKTLLRSAEPVKLAPFLKCGIYDFDGLAQALQGIAIEPVRDDPIVLSPAVIERKDLFSWINQIDLEKVNRILSLVADEIEYFKSFQAQISKLGPLLSILKNLDLLKLGKPLINLLKDPQLIQNLIELFKTFVTQTDQSIANQ